MEIILFIGFILFLFYLYVRKGTRKYREMEQAKAKLKSGESVRLITGDIVPKHRQNSYGLTLTEEFEFLKEKGTKYGYFHAKRDGYDHAMLIDRMSLDELRKAKISVQNKIDEERDKEFKKRQEQDRLESISRWKKKQKDAKMERWGRITKRIESELTKENNSAGIYVIICYETYEIYIGSSRNLYKRKQQHLSGLKANRHNSYKLQEAYNNYGTSKIRFYNLGTGMLKILAEFYGEEKSKEIIKRDLKYHEQEFIDKYLPEFNIDFDTKGRGHFT